MILKIKNWCEGLIVAIIISIIIEMLVPEGKNKKYVKVVVGIYIMFCTLNPILELLNYDVKFEKNIKFENISTVADLNTNIKDVYILGIEESIKKEIEELGYNVESVLVETDSNYENISKIELKVTENKSNIKKVENISIGKKDSQTSNSKYEEIVNYLKENYYVEEEKIIFR